jgi:hypothetical protein
VFFRILDGEKTAIPRLFNYSISFDIANRLARLLFLVINTQPDAFLEDAY